MAFQHNFKHLIRIISSLVLAAIVLLTVGRGIFFLAAVDFSQLAGLSEDVGRAFWVGMRFDAKIAAIAFAPMLLIGLVLASFKLTYSVWRACLPSYSAIIFFLLAGFSIGNYYYYTTYGNYIDVFAFGLFDDDTAAVLENAWADHPIFRSFLASLAVSLVAFIGTKRLLARAQAWHWPKRHWALTTVSVVAFILVYVVIARGSVGSLPLKRYHANVSQYKVLNVITPNAFMALDWAKSDYKKQSKFEPVSAALVTEQMEKMLGQPTPEYHTPANAYLEANPPHVVMTLMEGFSLNVLVEDDPVTNDVLGGLRPHIEEDFFFTRFMAGTSATIDSIVMMLFHSDIPTISHSSAQKVELPSSAVLPYKQAGYDVVFVYGGNSMWRNLANYLPRQGFDVVYDENSIKKAFPEASKYADTWGVADEFTFKFARKLLDEATKPTMIYIMTVSNHSPFRAPDYYRPTPVTVSERLTTLLGPMADEAKDLLEVYQYANHVFGEFVSGIKASPELAQRTLIAGSGDHRMRYLSTDREDEFALSFGVPFYLYVPSQILENSDNFYDPARIGSHRDVFPTLYHYSLSEQAYISLGGVNMLSHHGGTQIGYGASRTLYQVGASSSVPSDQYYPWGQGVMSQAPITADEPFTWAAEYRKLQNYYLRSQVLPTNPY